MEKCSIVACWWGGRSDDSARTEQECAAEVARVDFTETAKLGAKYLVPSSLQNTFSWFRNAVAFSVSESDLRSSNSGALAGMSAPVYKSSTLAGLMRSKHRDFCERSTRGHGLRPLESDREM